MTDFNKDDIVDGVLDHVAGMEITNTDAIVTLAVDAAIRYVVDFLYRSGQNGTADFLEMELEASGYEA